ncbi:PREDICTED: uncharacterized protein LOC109219146 isoform X1 [Nicotiana attenuata]|uniref:PB1 domain-containing protein n=1 Tax=Nicotiana attenuata TaxID=49451 RepID=A0A1J6JU68_NICAT|nr:PREDICTED: uncharacterized protein LOC109219146 isoform X1 [Nicotiana attenuata]OIT21266.1 hypothetical protein A4A49_34930 [Nicotiana attenuata]
MSSPPNSPKNKIKFLCSHGGKILPRPADGHLKYVGGETRVISVPRDIKFHELMKKLSAPIEGDMVLKYQLVPEDLDALVSVKSDEDLRHMLDEYDRCEIAGVPRLRAFLFPVKPIVLDHHVASSEPLEQRYIDAVNGIVRISEAGIFRLHPPPGISHASFGISSACSSPRSPESCTTEGVVNQENFTQSNYHNRSQMHKVHSSPSIFNMTSQQQRHGFHHQFHNYKPPVHQFAKPPPVDPERLISVRSVGRAEGMRYHVDHNSPHYYHSTTRHNHNRGNGCMHYEDYGERTDSLSPVDKRNGSFSPSPHSLSPLAGSTDS